MSTPDVLIVGAGAAGIAAARELTTLGCTSLILESRARVGGRAWTDTESLGAPIDMGCAWLHSADENPWTSYAVANGFQVMRRDPHWQRRIGRDEPSPEYQARWMAAWTRNERLIADSVRTGRDLAVSDVVPDDEFRPLFDAIMGWLMGATSERVSTVDFDRYADTNTNWAIAEGLGSVVAHAARGLDVRLSTRVQRIDCNGMLHRVHTERGVIEARSVIVTVPTTVLLKRGPAFLPEVDISFYEALEHVPLGVANKVFYRMKPGTLPFDGMLHFTGTNLSARTGSYGVRPGGQELLLAFFGGNTARELEACGELDRFARDELSRIFGREILSNIVASHSTAWAQDPDAMGSYSVALPGYADDRMKLATPLRDGLYYAGEASSLEHFGTIHGAWAMGVQAARDAAAFVRAG